VKHAGSTFCMCYSIRIIHN